MSNDQNFSELISEQTQISTNHNSSHINALESPMPTQNGSKLAYSNPNHSKNSSEDEDSGLTMCPALETRRKSVSKNLEKSDLESENSQETLKDYCVEFSEEDDNSGANICSAGNSEKDDKSPRDSNDSQQLGPRLNGNGHLEVQEEKSEAMGETSSVPCINSNTVPRKDDHDSPNSSGDATISPEENLDNIGDTLVKETQTQVEPQQAHNRTDSLSSSLSVGSLSLQSASLASFDYSGTGGGTDSALGDSASSKRSSLDRKSQASSFSGEFGMQRAENQNECSTSGHFPSDNNIAGPNKKRGIVLPTISLPKGLFSRKTNCDLPPSGVAPTPWRLFGGAKEAKAPAVQSTTSLILEDRPASLPAKSEEEAAKHRKQFEQMVEAAKKKEAKEAKLRKKEEELKRKAEEQVSSACKFWSNEIIPRWEEMKGTKRSRELWWEGIPPSVRGRVWILAIGNDLNLTTELHEICAARAKEKIASSAAAQEEHGFRASTGDKSRTGSENGYQPSSATVRDPEGTSVINRESTVELVHLDVSRTFPSLGIFQEGGPYYDLLLNLLGAYVCYRPDVGYVQGMSFLAAVLLLNMDAHEAFVAFSNLLNRSLQLSFYRVRQTRMTEYFIAYDLFLNQELPKLHAHFDSLEVRPDLYLIEWLYTMYAKSLPLDVTCRVWDVYLRDGDDFLFKVAVGILSLYQDRLLGMSEFDECVDFLTHLPESLVANDLFSAIDTLYRKESSVSGDRKSFDQFLIDAQSHTQSANICATHGSASPAPTHTRTGSGFSGGHIRRPSDASLASVSSANISKSLSGVLGDWLTAPADRG